MRKQYSGQVEAQRKTLIQSWTVILLFLKWAAAGYWNQPTQLGPCRHGNTLVSVLEWPGTMGPFQGSEHSGYRLGRFLCFMCMGKFWFLVLWLALETFPTCNKLWPRRQVFMQIATWKESIKVFNREIMYF